MKINDKEVEVITLTNENNMSVEILNLGGIITKIMVPDKNGKLENVVLGYEDYQEYGKNQGYLGTLIGRTSGRIGGANFVLDGITYKLPENNNGNCLHGGIYGFDKKIWAIENLENNSVTLSLVSPDGEEGFPGEVHVSVIYTLAEDNSLSITYTGQTDKKTLLNLTNHSYFNLSGDAKTDVLNHELTLKSKLVAEGDEFLIPTGNLIDVNEVAAFDFRTPKKIGKDIDDPALALASGYDHPFILEKGEGLKKDCVVMTCQESGRKMTMDTTYDAVVIYTSNFPNHKKLIGGNSFEARDGICFEAQQLPIGRDDCNKCDSILKSDQEYNHTTIYRFSNI
ncbi:aldose epimerase family protein [Candidatus Epulonipiscium viviparus]|uniref:aldose epimerase family protein n=1 Tax=Candidatus Epulonipiscium viviparus TaxID=420336 RepID=UPI00273810D0|nr:aldose epimerase family protein [Candidatus Epulopiscium viviparus]